MTCDGRPAFWCSGGDLVQTGGRALGAGRAEALLAWCASAADAADDPLVRSYFRRLRAELVLALEQVRRWRRASAVLG